MAKKNQKTHKAVSWIVLIFMTVLALGLGWMHIQARIVHIRHADVALADLPAALDGIRILYLSDLDVSSDGDARRTARLLNRLQAFWPDALLIGGDFTSPSLFSPADSDTESQYIPDVLFQALKEFTTSMGKLAVSGDNDDITALRPLLADANIALIDGQLVRLEKDGTALTFAGMGAGMTDANVLSRQVQGNECVIALAYSPVQSISIRIAEASGGGRWTDLILAGHTHGGQIRIADHPLFPFNEQERRYLQGWFTEVSPPMLVSQGLGCEFADLRLNTQSEVWLITLRTGE